MNSMISRNWYYLLLGAIVSTSIVCGGITIRCNPTASEKVLFYVSSLSVDTSKLVSESQNVSTEEIRQIRVNHETVIASENSRMFGLVYDSTDIYIYPESQLERTIPLSAKLSEDNVNTLLPNAINKELKNECAIKIYDASSEEGCLKSIIDYYISDARKENYYLSFYKSSLHIGELNNSQSNNALMIANHLLQL